MRRQMCAVVLGIVLSYLLSALGGYLLYRFGGLAWQTRLMSWIFVGPGIALLVGLCVGAVANNRPSEVAALSLMPWAATLIFYQSQDSLHRWILVAMAVVYVAIGAAAAAAMSWLRKSIRQRRKTN